MRWQMETTFQEARRHLGVETQGSGLKASNPEDHSGAVGIVLARYPLRPPANDAKKHAGRPAGSMVPQTLPNVLRCSWACTQGIVGARDEFSRVAHGHRYGKSPASVHGAPNRNALLCSLMDEVKLLRGRVNKGKKKGRDFSPRPDYSLPSWSRTRLRRRRWLAPCPPVVQRWDDLDCSCRGRM